MRLIARTLITTQTDRSCGVTRYWREIWRDGGVERRFVVYEWEAAQ